MSDSPWFRLFPADYFAKTGRLTRSEHGAYLLLLLHYYSTGPLPNNDADLAALSKCTRREWIALKPRIWPYFREGDTVLHHVRCDEEIEHRNALIRQKKEAGSRGGKAKHTLQHMLQRAPEQTAKRNPSKSESESEHINPSGIEPTRVEQSIDPFADLENQIHDDYPEIEARPKAAKLNGEKWWVNNEGVDKKGRELGLMARGGEDYPTYKNRLFEEIARRKSAP